MASPTNRWPSMLSGRVPPDRYNADLRSKIAQHVAQSVPDSKSIIIDAFCGVGGNTIAFALSGKWKRVYAIEKDAATLACAKHNAEIYGVSDKITWFHGDCFEILGVVQKEQVTVDALKAIAGQFGVIFASPPWGGKSISSLMAVGMQGLHLTQVPDTETPRYSTSTRWSRTASSTSTSRSGR